MERIKPKKTNTRLTPNQVTISTNAHRIYLGENARNYLSNHNFVDIHYDKELNLIGICPCENGDYAIMRSNHNRKTEQVFISIPHSLLELFEPFSGRHNIIEIGKRCFVIQILSHIVVHRTINP